MDVCDPGAHHRRVDLLLVAILAKFDVPNPERCLGMQVTLLDHVELASHEMGYDILIVEEEVSGIRDGPCRLVEGEEHPPRGLDDREVARVVRVDLRESADDNRELN